MPQWPVLCMQAAGNLHVACYEHRAIHIAPIRVCAYSRNTCVLHNVRIMLRMITQQPAYTKQTTQY